MEALAIRLCDVDVDDNENPILGLKDEPILSFEEAVSHWQRLSSDVLDKDDVALAVECAKSTARKRKAMNPADPLTLDQIAAIHLYTQQSPIYSVLNAQLRNHDRNALKPAFPYLKLFLTALYSLPPVSSVTVYRGIKGDLSAKFRDGTEHQWWEEEQNIEIQLMPESRMRLSSPFPLDTYNTNHHRICLRRPPSAASEAENPEDMVLVYTHPGLEHSRFLHSDAHSSFPSIA